MSVISSQAGNIPVKKGELIFLEGQTIESINILLQGKTNVYLSILDKYNDLNEEEILKKSYKLFSIDQNFFIGANEWFNSRKYSFSYYALEDSSIYLYPNQGMDQVKALLSSQKDYGAYILTSICSLITNSYFALCRIGK